MRHATKFAMMVAVLALAGTAHLEAQEITLTGQLRPRMETRSMTGRADEFTSMRARAAIHAQSTPSASIHLELQDVRLWGGELITTVNPDRIELHQGYLDLGRPHAKLSGRIGRQEASYGEERLIGVSDWTQPGRAFDGGRARIHHGNTTVDGFAYQIADAVEVDKTINERFLGAYATIAGTPLGAIDGYVLHNRVAGSIETRQTTLGARFIGARGTLNYRVEAAAQRGLRKDAEVHAWMGTARLTLAPTKAAQLTLWYDYLSGDDSPADTETRGFDTLFGTNHKFYGTADLFTNLPVHTANRGLQDIALKSAYQATKDVTINVDLHEFRAAAGKGLASGDFGKEADVNAAYRYSPKLVVNGGASYFAKGAGLDAIKRVVPSQVFTYIMLTATF